MQGDFPNPQTNSWNVTVLSTYSGGVTIQVYAVCFLNTGTPPLRLTAASVMYQSQSVLIAPALTSVRGTAVAQCPSGFTPAGGGYHVQRANGSGPIQAAVLTSAPATTGVGTVWGVAAINVDRYAALLTASVVCVNSQLTTMMLRATYTVPTASPLSLRCPSPLLVASSGLNRSLLRGSWPFFTPGSLDDAPSSQSSWSQRVSATVATSYTLYVMCVRPT